MDKTNLNVDNYDGRFTWRCAGVGADEPIVYDVDGAGSTPDGSQSPSSTASAT